VQNSKKPLDAKMEKRHAIARRLTSFETFYQGKMAKPSSP